MSYTRGDRNLSLLSLVVYGTFEEFKHRIQKDACKDKGCLILQYVLFNTDNTDYLYYLFSLLKTISEKNEFANTEMFGRQYRNFLQWLAQSNTGNVFAKTKFLLEMGANPNIYPSIDIVIDNRGTEWLALFLKHGAKHTCFKTYRHNLFRQNIINNIEYVKHNLIMQTLVSIGEIPRIGKHSPMFKLSKEIIREVFKFLI
jgi:hypothetical protein